MIMSDAMDVVRSLAEAKKSLEAWSGSDAASRSSVLSRIADNLEADAESIAWAIAEAEGWSASFAKNHAVLPMASLFRKTAASLDEAELLRHRPTGVLALILPSVFSFRVLGERLAPALAAGNTVVVKISSRSPVTQTLWKKVLESSGLPAGVVSLLVGSGAEIGEILARHPSVRGISFAGRPQTAASVLSLAAAMGKKLQISAGAKNSLMIHPEAHLDDLPKMLESVLTGAGRLPWALQRIYVSESRAEEFFTKLRDCLSRLEPLTSPDGESAWTPMDSSFDREKWSSILEQVRQDHGKVFAGGDFEGERHVRPLFVTDMTNCSTLQLEEVPGPLVIVTTVKYPHEMIKWTNTGDFGFCASIWGPEDKASRLGAKLEVGRVWINSWFTDDEAFAGWKRSFFGIPDFRWNGGFFSDVKKLA